MCIITDSQNIVKSLSLIPGLEPIPLGWIIYFPWVGELPQVGDTFNYPDNEYRSVVGGAK